MGNNKLTGVKDSEYSHSVTEWSLKCHKEKVTTNISVYFLKAPAKDSVKCP